MTSALARITERRARWAQQWRAVRCAFGFHQFTAWEWPVRGRVVNRLLSGRVVIRYPLQQSRTCKNSECRWTETRTCGE